MENKRIQVFDFEALNWNKLYAVGIYAGDRAIYLAEEGKPNAYFAEWLLENLESGICAYAHNGGRYDFLFIFEYCEKVGLTPYALKLIHGSIAEFRLRYKDKKFLFRDSLLILPASLKRLTQDFDVPHKKLELDYGKGMKDPRFAEYFKNDLYGLYEVLLSSGLTDHLTIASCAMANFKKDFYRAAMERNIKAMEMYFRDAYKGGRVEIFKLYGKDLNYYDVNSLYPSVMYDYEYPLPIANNFKKVYKFDKGKLGVYDVSIEIDKLEIPVLHKNISGKFIFPIGRFKGRYYTPEIVKAMEMGYKVKVIFGYEFIKTDYMFRDYVDYFYMIKTESVGAKKQVAKLLLNSLYGKFGQKREQEVNAFIKDGTISNLNFITKKYWDEHSTYIHPEIAGLITAYARTRLYEIFQKAGVENVYYCDTDSVITDSTLPVSNTLGELKQEDKIKEFIALAPKLYAYSTVKNEIKIKSKGFKAENFTFDDFRKGLSGDISVFEENRERLATIKERYRRTGIDTFAGLLNIQKRLRGLYDKRVVVDGIHTKPLNIIE